MPFIRPAVLVAVLSTPALAQSATIVETLGDASIARDSPTTWAIAAGGAVLTIESDPSRDFRVVSLTSPSKQLWIRNGGPGTSITVNGATPVFGSRAAGFQHETATTSNDGTVIRLDVAMIMPSTGLRVTRHIAAVSGSPTFETWTTFEAVELPITVANVNAFELTLVPGTVHWLNGLQGDAADVTHDSAFTLRQQDVAVGSPLVLGARGRSSEQTVPWFAIDGTHDEFYAGLMWSGAWSLSIQRSSAELVASFGLPAMATTVTRGRSIDGPHAFFGVAAGRLPQASAALRSYIVNGIRSGRPFSPFVTYNTWFAYGTAISEDSMRAEMDGAAALGAELFVIDAGWYEGAGAANAFDYDSGLGSWQVDATRFPDGLASLTDYAHSLGMKFGVWIEPERVNLSIVGYEGLDETWLVTNGGDYGSDHAALLCLSGAAGRQWVVDRVSGLVDAVQPDYVKWDNNMWVNCDRAGHGHAMTDGNFAQVTGLYEVLDTLRSRYPNVTIENVSGGGNRLDFGMLRYTDVAWMDDRTAPSVHVRHNIEGLAAAFPPAYLLSFLTDHDAEPLHDAPDMPLYVRSRMGGALGLCFRTADLSTDDAAQISHEIDIYKNVRSTLSVAAGALLTPQAEATDGPDWDVLQAASPDGNAIVVYAYEGDDATDTFNVRPADLQPGATYSVSSVDVGLLGTATGAALMSSGVDVLQSTNTAAHILILIAQQ
jgi:alpha-galactosidase